MLYALFLTGSERMSSAIVIRTNKANPAHAVEGRRWTMRRRSRVGGTAYAATRVLAVARYTVRT